MSHLRYTVLEQSYKCDPQKPWAVEPYNYIEYIFILLDKSSCCILVDLNQTDQLGSLKQTRLTSLTTCTSKDKQGNGKLVQEFTIFNNQAASVLGYVESQPLIITVGLINTGQEAELKFQTSDEWELVRNLLPYSGSDLMIIIRIGFRKNHVV